ncbi:hypothetical protein BX616_007987 [Lobosporangium transversale]|nr:hypothetical protein BX616_007987 [Lobosporangium transversale]
MVEKDLELLDNVELRFALAESDAQLEKTLNTFLCPVLLKLASPAENVRAKVVSILTHINRRVRPKPEIKLPVPALLKQFSDSSSPLVKNFTLIYIELGYERISLQDKLEALPQLIKGISRRPVAQQTTLLHMAIAALSSIKQINEDSTMTDPYGFTGSPSDAMCLLLRFQDVLLYRQPLIGSSHTQRQQRDNATSSSGDNQSNATGLLPIMNPPPEGMSPHSVQLVTNSGKASWASTSELKNVKIGVLRFINSTVNFPDSLPAQIHLERFIALIAASGDAYHEVSSMGEDGLKRIKAPDFENKMVIDRLYEMYQGSNKGKPIAGQEDTIRQPSSNPIKLRIMGYLSKSKVAADSFPSALQVSFDCLYGTKTNAKLIMAGMAFVQWIARMASLSTLKPMAPVLLSGMLKYIRESEDARGLVPELFRNDLTILGGLFDQLATQSSNVKMSIQESICTMLDAFHPLKDWATDADVARIRSLIEDNMNREEHQARYCAVKYANILFSFSDIFSKYVCLMTVADEKLEIREEAKRGLTFPTARLLEQNLSSDEATLLPNFTQLLELITAKSVALKEHTTGMQGRWASGKSTLMGYSLEVYTHMLQFFRRLLITTADPEVIIEESSNEYELQQFVFTPSTRTRIKDFLKKMWDLDNQIDNEQKTMSRYIFFLEAAMNYQGSHGHLMNVAFQSFIGSPKLESRVAVAHIIGIVGTDNLGALSAQREVFLQLMHGLHSTIKDTSKSISSEQQHGSVLTIGFLLGRLKYRYSNQSSEIIPILEMQSIVNDIVALLDGKQSMFVSGACAALGEIGRYGILPSDDTTKVIQKIIGVANNTTDVKTQEQAITALGHISVGDPSQSHDILSFLYDFGPKQTKQAELNFTIGEAIACIGAGWQCTLMDTFADIADKEPSTDEVPSSVMDGILNSILNDMSNSPKAALKKAACIWLLSLVKFCASHASIKTQLPKIHAVFSSLLSDRDELTQEVASKGIGLVYELGDQSIRSQLVESLVGMFGEGRKAAPKVTGDTELFEGNALGQAPDGSSLSTYQSILSLASDMNQPELVYKFMHLASHNSMWQSRKGAAFGFSTIVSQAEAELKPYLATLIPRLYRYQYDPNPKVHDAMTSIWRALVKEPKKAVQEYFDVIVKDLLEGMGARAWRTRESSCLAMADLLQGRSIEEIEKYLEDIWTMSFRTLDDIKESVRTAAFKTCKALTMMTVKYCDPKHVTASQGQRVLDIMVPFLLQKGLMSSAEEVSKFSLSTILKICKQAGPLLQTHIPSIVVALLEGLTSMEPQMMNYLSFHTEKYQVSQEQLESTRLNAAKLSPMMEGVEACLENVDESTMPALSEQVIVVIKKAVGLPTKAGCAHLLVSICIKKPSLVAPYSDAILKILGSAIKDKSPAVRKSYAVAVGYLSRLTTDSQLVRFIERLIGYYLDTEEEELRSISAITVREISKNASDKFKGVASAILPTVYYGTFDSNKTISDIWKEVWEDNTSGSSSAVKLYALEIIQLLSKQLTSSSWNAKKQSASALKAMSEIIDLTGNMDLLLPLVLDGLSGRTWEGKEHIAELLPAIAISAKEFFVMNPTKLQDIAKVLLRESKKINKQYRRHAISALGTLLDNFPELDFYSEVKSILIPIVENEGDSDGDDEEQGKPLQLIIMANAAKTLGMAWTTDVHSQEQYSEEFVSCVCKALVRNVWNVRSALIVGLEKFLERLRLDVPERKVISEESLLTLLDSLLEGSLQDYKYVALRNQGLDLLKALVDKLKGTHALTPVVLTKLHDVLSIVKNDPLPSISEVATLIRSELEK